ncbi:sugar transferase [Oceaniglobus trochenteri]|uniref:sugar transferase n=1 Tax=Oceaniglobus trochenteri TaxID=2763260 RepID=UPI001D0000CF|nr:sugar transferase [Oceaniglobus trochenteri]
MDNPVKNMTVQRSIDRSIGPGAGRGIGLPMRRSGMDLCKRLVDIVGASLLLVFFMPLLAVIAGALFVCHGGNVLFRHRRVGRDGVPFDCLKFCSMHADADRLLAECLERDTRLRMEWHRNRKLARDPRVHALGRLLRKSSLDELPQFLNVLRGEMSLVGPRPVVREEAGRYGGNFAFYLALRPGITGLWQVSGRNDTTYDERVALDVRYFHERSLWFDIRIMLRTLVVVFTGKGAC